MFVGTTLQLRAQEKIACMSVLVHIRVHALGRTGLVYGNAESGSHHTERHVNYIGTRCMRAYNDNSRVMQQETVLNSSVFARPTVRLQLQFVHIDRLLSLLECRLEEVDTLVGGRLGCLWRLWRRRG